MPMRLLRLVFTLLLRLCLVKFALVRDLKAVETGTVNNCAVNNDETGVYWYSRYYSKSSEGLKQKQ